MVFICFFSKIFDANIPMKCSDLEALLDLCALLWQLSETERLRPRCGELGIC